jgi:hypothetical protein
LEQRRAHIRLDAHLRSWRWQRVPIEMERAHVWPVEDGQIRRIGKYMDRVEALEAVGLRE